MTPRFFLERVEGDEVVLPRADSHHLLRVLRAGPGTPFVVLSGGMAYDCVLHRVEDGLARGRIRAAEPAAGEPAIRITLFQGLAKGEKMELVLQHGTELGIAEFVAVAAARSVVRLDERKAAQRTERWQRIAREAAEQSRRGAVPTVAPPHTWKEAVARIPEFDLALVAWEGGGEPLRAALEARPEARDIAVFIGPEGGLTAEEVELARQAGAVPVTLGPRILRTETAPLAAVAAILYARGEWG
ncbi:16S rRNA (uracil(1498)-N(3))-methyltransferase [Symbiobacterium thermophilum]|uniref:Ribosomal RNA small subunit methyltransferase E n=1 Tax=Symbiobacterium thermophilum TaxID=2734 RepID=A0A953I2W5_SYMTR|nr:16S rRNA (uracil(1498)-N(3))-methyltransferase [Symbiobacterium thermophilum]MBY6275937.1 16S rRNA (uracil(1498)-N(3))-methyltransferase [Symbiobacterium thermophilum]